MADDEGGVIVLPQTSSNKMSFIDRRFVNIIILGISFMMMFTAFQTMAMAQESILENSGFSNGSGYTSLAIIYAVFATLNFIAPPVVSLVGPKLAMALGGLMYCLFIASFIKPMLWSLYFGSVLVGFGAAVIWTAQGNFLTINSDPQTVGRNSGVFWALLQCSLLWGNLYVYFTFKGNIDISSSSRLTLSIVLTVVCGVGVVMLFFLRNQTTPETDGGNLNEDVPPPRSRFSSAVIAFKQSFKLLATKKMLLLSVCSAYTGLELTFFSGVYGTCVGHNYYFEPEAKSLIGLVGVCIGAGEILGGAAFGLMGSRTNRYGRDPIVLLGLVVHLVSFYLIFLNLPGTSTVVDGYTKDTDLPYINSKIYLALICAFLLGFGDACFNTQMYSLLGFLYPDDSAPAFALFKFTQSLAAAAGFFYSNHLLLPYQLLILTVTGVLGAASFFVVEWEATKDSQEGYSQI